jgi:hypothetical protein
MRLADHTIDLLKLKDENGNIIIPEEDPDFGEL